MMPLPRSPERKPFQPLTSLMFDPRRSSHILVVAPGQDPAGTLECAVVCLGEEGRIPDEIHVIASRQRLAAIQGGVLSAAGARRFAVLCAQAGFARDEILFNRRTLHPLDMNGEGGCAAAADRLLDLLRRLSSSNDTALTVAVAEEAGVPGYLLHCCLQVAGRSSDRLVILTAGAANGTRARSGRSACRQFEVPLLLWPPTDPPPATYAEAVLTRGEPNGGVRPAGTCCVLIVAAGQSPPVRPP